MNKFDVEFTKRWWEVLLGDEERMARWLQKLQKTEFSGYADNLAAIDQWAGDNIAAQTVLRATAEDELRHSDLLVEVLNGRGLSTDSNPPESVYWSEMDKEINDLSSCAAVFHLGEQLACDRFEVLIQHPGTPDDIMGFLKSALPDEQYHARSFRKLTDDVTLSRIIETHYRIVERLKGQ
jgi:tRNA isopentenyl-2-thiomethyl-A-37 hydroxylase MiaE